MCLCARAGGVKQKGIVECPCGCSGDGSGLVFSTASTPDFAFNGVVAADVAVAVDGVAPTRRSVALDRNKEVSFR